MYINNFEYFSRDLEKYKSNKYKSLQMDFPGGPVVKTLPSNAGGVGSIPGR